MLEQLAGPADLGVARWADALELFTGRLVAHRRLCGLLRFAGAASIWRAHARGVLGSVYPLVLSSLACVAEVTVEVLNVAGIALPLAS